MANRVKINRYKDSGKWLEELAFKTDLLIFENVQIQQEAENKYPVLKNEIYTMEIRDNSKLQYNGRLVNNHKQS